jgi:single-strand DNA-binding protein
LIEGRLKLDQWEKDGQKRSKLKVVAENLTLLGGKEKAERQPEQRGEMPPARQPQGDVGGDDIPF